MVIYHLCEYNGYLLKKNPDTRLTESAMLKSIGLFKLQQQNTYLL